MDPITEKALTLGTAIAKSVVTHWLRERMEPKDTDNITSTFKKYIPEALSQRRAQIQLERISVSIAEQIQSIFRIEGARLDEGSIAAVADAISRTLDKAYITPRVLAEHNLNPTKLVALCRSIDPAATRDFSEPERELYNSILSYAAQFICDTASRLPSFTEKTLGEILTRDDIILSKVNEIAANFQRIHEALSPTSDSAHRDKFEADFRLATIRRLSELSLFGLDVSETSRHYSLTVAYVALTMQQRTPASPQDRTSDHSPPPATDDLEQTISIEDGLESASRKTLIIGHAGSGKTTLLQWLAVQAAGRSLEGRLSTYNDCVPFFIRLRDFANSTLPEPERFVSLTAPEIGGRMPPGWVHERLSQSKAIILIDGVDELPRNQRSTLREWVLALHAEYPGSPLFLTSRPYASNDEWYERSGFQKVELQPMDLPRIGEFIDHWHDAIEVQLTSQSQKAALTPLAHGLKLAIGSQPRLAELASTPLLCAMICALYRDRNQRLPSDRVGLYRACIEALVDRRDPERRIALTDYPDLSFRHKLLLLQDFAYYLLRNSLTEASHEQLESRLTSKLPTLGLSSTPTTRDVSKLLIERSGVLREVVAGRVDFIHKTFQEFLAAQAVLDEGDFGLLTKNASDDEWREVIILAAGLAPPRVTDQLISSLILEGDGKKARRHQLHLLAVGCLGAASATSEALRADVGKRIKALVPPTSLREAKELAAAGDLAVPFLRTEKRLKSQHAAACVRALSLVGTEAALDVLKTYAHDTRQAVRQELFRGWPSFDPEEYAKSILKDDMFVIVKPGVPLSALRHLNQLTYLTIDGAAEVSATPLTQLQHLKTLSVYGGRTTAAADLTDLSKLVELEELLLRKISTATLPSLASLKRLKDVDLSELPNLQGIEELLNAKCLERIHLSDLPQVAHIPQLHKIKTLRDVSIRNVGNSQTTHRGWFPQHLQSLNIELREGFDNLEFLSNLTSLTHLGLSTGRSGRIPFQEFLEHLERTTSHLRSLHLAGIHRKIDLSFFAHHEFLGYLSLGGIDGFFNAAELNHTQIPLNIHLRSMSDKFDLSGIEAINRPFDLSISFGGFDSKIDLTPLLSCKTLKKLSLDYVRVVDMGVLKTLKKKLLVDARSVWS